jgi:methylglyoxal synthase
MRNIIIERNKSVEMRRRTSERNRSPEIREIRSDVLKSRWKDDSDFQRSRSNLIKWQHERGSFRKAQLLLFDKLADRTANFCSEKRVTLTDDIREKYQAKNQWYHLDIAYLIKGEIKLAIEIDGSWGHTNEYDHLRDQILLREFFIPTLRFSNDDVFLNLDEIVEQILKYVTLLELIDIEKVEQIVPLCQKKSCGTRSKAERSLLVVDYQDTKSESLNWLIWKQLQLQNWKIYTNSESADFLQKHTQLSVDPYQQGFDSFYIGRIISSEHIDLIVVFWNPLSKNENSELTIKVLTNIADLLNIPIACNRATADFLISSPLLYEDYERILPNYDTYEERFKKSIKKLKK